MQGHPRKPHSGFVLPQFVPVDQPGRMFLKKKITFPTLNCDNISGLHELYTKKEAKKKKKNNLRAEKKKLTQTSGGEKCLWGT